MKTIEVDGYTFKVAREFDHDAGLPWEREEGHGPVSDWTRRDKRPGELVLSEDHSSKRFYDFTEACRIALRDGWGSYGWQGGSEGMSRKQFAAEAAREDYKRLKAWCDDEWGYVGVVVTLLDVEGNETDAVQSLCGIESDSGSYLDETANELAGDVLHDVSAMLHGDDASIYASGSRYWRVK